MWEDANYQTVLQTSVANCRITYFLLDVCVPDTIDSETPRMLVAL